MTPGAPSKQLLWSRYIMEFLPIVAVLSLPLYIQLIYIALCLAVGFFGRNKVMRFWGNFFCAIVLSPIIGGLIILVSEQKKS
jgi:hypothetical protein